MMKMRTWLILIASLCVITKAHADTYHRFWRGTKRADLNWNQFEAGLNQVFIPATVKTGAEKGMIGYQPVLLEGEQGLPDEVALVSYADQQAYDALYSTDPGKDYQNLHWNYFDRATSHSIIPQAFNGAVDLEQAYDLHPEYRDWMKNTTTVLVYFKQSGEAQADYIKRAQSHLLDAVSSDGQIGILDRVILVSETYWIEYASSLHALTGEIAADKTISIQNEKPENAKIILGQGVNLDF